MTKKERERRMSITDEINLQRIRDKWGKESTVAATDIRFLLSLLDSQAAEQGKLEEENGELAGIIKTHGDTIVKQVNAATRMRDACVGELKELLHAHSSEDMQSLCGHNHSIRQAITALESLTLDQVEQENTNGN